MSHRPWLKFGVLRTSSHSSSSCAHDAVVLILHDSPFHFLLSLFSPIVLFILRAFTFFFHGVGGTSTLRTLANEDLFTLAEYDTLTGFEPNDLHISETTGLYIQESSGENRSLNSPDLDYDDYTIGIALSSPLFTQEREDAARCRHAYHSLDEGLSSSQSSSVGHRTVRPVVEQFDSQIPNIKEIPRHSSEGEQNRILLERQREQILADCQAETRKHESQADYDR